jgi:hypothetical protein
MIEYIQAHWLSKTLLYLYNLLIYNFSFSKVLIIALLVFLFFEFILGWYVPESTKYCYIKDNKTNKKE